MGLGNSREIAAAGMSAQRLRMEIVAANIANARTTRTAEGGPYSRRYAIFRASELELGQMDAFSEQLRQQLRTVQVADVQIDDSPPRREFQPGHPDADAAGYVSFPNINVVEEMVNMIGAARSYEANLEVLKSVGGMSNAALDIGGR